MSVLSERQAQAIIDVAVSLGLAIKASIWEEAVNEYVRYSWSDVGDNICELIEAVGEEENVWTGN